LLVVDTRLDEAISVRRAAGNGLSKEDKTED
jgi:hypothetical protein